MKKWHHSDILDTDFLAENPVLALHNAITDREAPGLKFCPELLIAARQEFITAELYPYDEFRKYDAVE